MACYSARKCGGRVLKWNEGSGGLGRVFGQTRWRRRLTVNSCFRSSLKGIQRLVRHFSWHCESAEGLLTPVFFGHRTTCSPSNVRKRALFPHRPVWTRSFRWDPGVSNSPTENMILSWYWFLLNTLFVLGIIQSSVLSVYLNLNTF